MFYLPGVLLIIPFGENLNRYCNPFRRALGQSIFLIIFITCIWLSIGGLPPIIKGWGVSCYNVAPIIWRSHRELKRLRREALLSDFFHSVGYPLWMVKIPLMAMGVWVVFVTFDSADPFHLGALRSVTSIHIWSRSILCNFSFCKCFLYTRTHFILRHITPNPWCKYFCKSSTRISHTHLL